MVETTCILMLGLCLVIAPAAARLGFRLTYDLSLWLPDPFPSSDMNTLSKEEEKDLILGTGIAGTVISAVVVLVGLLFLESAQVAVIGLIFGGFVPGLVLMFAAFIYVILGHVVKLLLAPTRALDSAYLKARERFSGQKPE